MRQIYFVLAALFYSSTASAIDWGDVQLAADESRFYFDITVIDVPVSATPSTFRMYTKFGGIIVQNNQQEFRIVFSTQDGNITEEPLVEPIGVPDQDRWLEGAVGDFTVTDLGGGSWRLAGWIINGTQPYQEGDQLGEFRFSYSGGTIGFGNPLIGPPPPGAMFLSKTSASKLFTTTGQIVHYDYQVFNTGPVTLHNVSIEDDNVDAPPVCGFDGNDELAPEGQPGESVKCTAQHTVTAQEVEAGDTIDNIATATADGADPVQASVSIPFAIFSDSFEGPPNIKTALDEDGFFSSIAIGADGNPVIGYYDAIGQALKVAWCTSPLCTAASMAVVDDLNETGWSPSIAIGIDGLPVISYFDRTAESLKVAKCNDAACKFGDETISVVDDESNVGGNTSIAIGDDGFPVIAYHDWTIDKLMVAKCNDAACSEGDELISMINDPAGVTGLHTSIAVGADGFPIISYQETSGPASTTLRVAKCNDAACAGNDETISIIENTGVAMFESTAIAIGDDDLPVIAYFDSLEGAIKVCKCNDAACAGNDETITVVDELQASQTLSIAIGDDGWPVLSYAALRVVKCNDAACEGGDELMTVVDGFGLSGHTSTAIGTDGRPVISYLADGLRVVRCGSESCQ